MSPANSRVLGAEPRLSDIAGHWASAAIKRFYDHGYITGYADGTFRPDRPVTRLESAVLIHRVLALPVPDRPVAPVYCDAEHIPLWAEEAVAAATALSVIKGLPDGAGGVCFAGDELLTRSQLAVIIFRLLEQSGQQIDDRGSASHYEDETAIPAWALDAVNSLTSSGLIKGDPGGRFNPHRPATRAELVVLLDRLLSAAGPADDDPAEQPVVPPAGQAGGLPYVVGFFARSYAGDQRALASIRQGAGVLTLVAEFGFPIDESGRISGGPDLELHQLAAEVGVPVVAVIHNDPGAGFDRVLASRILATAQSRQTAVTAIVNFLLQHSYSGVNIDFENVDPADRANFTDLIQRLDSALAEHGLLLTVSVPAQLSDDPKHQWSGAYDYSSIGSLVDYIVPMAYDEHWFGSMPGPIASQPWVAAAMAHTVAKVDAEKVLLGVPAYGYDWPVGATGGGSAVTSRRAAQMVQQHGAAVQWDDRAQVPYFHYGPGNARRVVYFENAHSLRAKLRIARESQLAGVALWRLGYEDEAIWPLLARFRQGQSLLN